ncbi:metal-dependent hydrolase [Lysobacter fragariae]
MSHATPARPDNVSITPRRLGIDYGAKQDIRADNWFNNNTVLTAFWTAFAGQFPRGERFLIDSVRLFRDQVTDKGLQKDIGGFIGQEAHHAQEHAALNDFLEQHGIPTARIDRQVDWVMKKLQRYQSKKQQIAATAGLEHFTSMFGDMTLSNPEILDCLPDTIRPMFLWHSIEETEHKAVAFDVYQAVDGSYPRLIAIYLFNTALLIATTLFFTTSVMISNRSLFNLRDWVGALHWMFGFGPRAGYFRKMLPEYFEFFRRDFHPWQRDNSAQIAQWKPVLEEMLAQSKFREKAAA